MAAGLVCKIHGATGLAVVVYGERTPAETVAEAIARKAAECGLSMVERFYVTGNGRNLIGDDAVSPMPKVHEAIAREVAEALPGDLEIRLAMLDASPLDLFEQSLSWGSDLETQSAATPIAMMNRPALRDIALVRWAHGFSAGESVLDAQIAWETASTSRRTSRWSCGARDRDRIPSAWKPL